MHLHTQSAAETQDSKGTWVIQIDQATESDWNHWLQEFDDASIYQSWAYGSVHWNPSQLSHLVIRKEDQVVSLTQVRIVTIPLLHRGVAYVRWGPLCHKSGREFDETVFGHTLEALREEYAIRRGLLLRVIPNLYDFNECSSRVTEMFAHHGFVHCPIEKPYRTLHVDLSQSLDGLRKGFSQRWRSKLKKAEAAGLTVTVGTTDDLYSRFRTAYDEMMRRKRFETTVNVGEFAQIQRVLPPSLKMQVLICERAGILLNALVLAPAGNTGIYLLAATSDAGLEADGAFLLQWHAVRLLKEMGCRWYDLGGASQERNPGGYQFKSGMGGFPSVQLGRFECRSNTLSYKCVSSSERLVRLAGRIRSRLGKRSPSGQPFPPSAATSVSGSPK